MRGTSERAHERSSARAGHGTKRVSAGTSARIERARKLSVYGTSGGAASSALSAVTISLTALPIPLRAPSRGVTSIATAGRAEADIGRWYHIRSAGRARHIASTASLGFRDFVPPI